MSSNIARSVDGGISAALVMGAPALARGGAQLFNTTNQISKFAQRGSKSLQPNRILTNPLDGYTAVLQKSIFRAFLY